MPNEVIALASLNESFRALRRFEITLGELRTVAFEGRDVEELREKLHANLDDYVDHYALATREMRR